MLNWMKNAVIRFLKQDDLQDEVRGLKAQVAALGGLLTEMSNEIASFHELVDQQYYAASSELTEVESRMMMRLAQDEEIRQSQSKDEESETPPAVGGYVRWTERLRRAEIAAADPSKYARKKKAPEEKQNANVP
jgi:hypothetical protein